MNIYNLNESHEFSPSEAEALVPILRKISDSTSKKLTVLNQKLSLNRNNVEAQEEINEVLQKWADHVRRLGGIPVSLYKVRILGKDDTYTWDKFKDGLFSTTKGQKIN